MSNPLKLILTILPKREEGTRHLKDFGDKNVAVDSIELEFANTMRQTVLKLPKHADAQVIVTFTASNLENGGSKMTPGKTGGDEGVGAGGAVTDGEAVVWEIADVDAEPGGSYSIEN